MISNILDQRSPTWLPGRRAGSGQAADLGGEFVEGLDFGRRQADCFGGGAGHLDAYLVLMITYPALYYFSFRPGLLDEGLKLVAMSAALRAFFVVCFGAGLLFHFLSPVNHLIGIYLYHSRKVYTCQGGMP
jgi:hypothetical protein